MNAIRSCRVLLALVAMLSPAIGAAHGLLLDADSDGETVFGTAYYSNGETAANESVSLLDLSAPDAAAVYTTSDAKGDFSFKTTRSHRYRVAVYGDEGHGVEVELLASAEPNPQLIDRDAPESPYWPPPAWAILGAVLLLSLIPVLVSRSRASA